MILRASPLHSNLKPEDCGFKESYRVRAWFCTLLRLPAETVRRKIKGSACPEVSYSL